MDIQPFLDRSSTRHSHLCPRQVLGVRIGLLAAHVFNLPPGGNPDKRLLTIVESDGCFSDGVEVATGCTPGHRTLRQEDYGKIAAVFVDTLTGRAIRIAPHLDARERAYERIPDEPRHYFAQLKAYQVLPDDQLLRVQDVVLNKPIEKIVSRPGVRVNCAICGEEIINEREVNCNGLALCQPCSGDGYYRSAMPSIPLYKTMRPLYMEAK